jgi:hypothetical protein
MHSDCRPATLALSALACAYARLGRREQSRSILRQMELLAAKRYVSPYDLVMWRGPWGRRSRGYLAGRGLPRALHRYGLSMQGEIGQQHHEFAALAIAGAENRAGMIVAVLA